MLTQRNATATRPAARYDKLVVTETADEVLLYDTEKHHIHHLNATTAAVWRLCDGKHTVVDIAREAGRELGAEMDEATVRLALTKLDDAGLLKESLVDELRLSRMSRRTFMQRAGIAGAIAMPAIVSMTSPAGAQFSCPNTCPEVPCPPGYSCVEIANDCNQCRENAPGVCGSCDGNGNCPGWSIYTGDGLTKCNNCYVWTCDPGRTPRWQWEKLSNQTGYTAQTCWRNNTPDAEIPFRGGDVNAPCPSGLVGITTARMGVGQAVVVTPSEGSAGDAVRIDVSGFEPNEQVSAVWAATDSVLGVTVVDGVGSGGLTTNVPQDSTANAYAIVVTGLSSGHTAETSFTVHGEKVVLNPAMSVSPGAGEAGSEAIVSVSGFDPTESISISFAGAYQRDVANDSSTSFTIPAINAGSYSFDALGATSGETASAGFEVQQPKVEEPPFVPNPVVNVSATSLKPGDVLTVWVSGYHPDEAITVTLNGNWAADTWEGGEVNLQMGQPGDFEVRATGGTTGASNFVWVNVATPEPPPQQQAEVQQAPAAVVAPEPTPTPEPAPTPTPEPVSQPVVEEQPVVPAEGGEGEGQT